MNGLKEFVQWIIDCIKIWVIIQPWESALITRKGKVKRVVGGGLYFKLPYLDSVYVVETKLRVLETNMLNIQLPNGKSVVMDAAIGYKITDIEKTFNKIARPEATIKNICQAYIYEQVGTGVDMKEIAKNITDYLNGFDYGIDFEYFKVMNYSEPRIIRLVQDNQWVLNGDTLNTKR